jgi:Family of unknown function (DUF5764)
MEDHGVSVYSETKSEYTTQLTQFLVPAFHRFFMDCLAQASQEEPQVKRQLWKFQELLSQVPEWNIDKVHREVQKIQGEIQCDYLEVLVTAVFVAHTKILTAIRIGNKNKRVQITIPKLDHFIHRALSECSRLLWSSAYLFHNELSPIEKQKNHRQVDQLLREGIAQAIRGLLPIKNILKDYLSEPAEEDTEDDADDEAEEEKKEEEPAPKEESSKKEEHVKTTEIVKEEGEVKELKEDKDTDTDKNKEEKPVEPPTQPVEQITLAEPPAQVQISEVKAPEPESESVPLVSLTEQPASASIPAPAVEEAPKTPTLVVQTSPTVQFTNYNSVIQTDGNTTSIGYEHTDHEPPSDEDVEFMDDHGEPLSDFEVLEGEGEALNGDDFETL